LGEAQDAYQKAIELFQSNPPEEHNRPAVLIDFKIHYQVARLLSGEMDAVNAIQQLISQLESLDETKFNKDIWISGAHMRIAEALMSTNPDLAKVHLNKAKEIIDANPELSLRSAQWQKINEKINPAT